MQKLLFNILFLLSTLQAIPQCVTLVMLLCNLASLGQCLLHYSHRIKTIDHRLVENMCDAANPLRIIIGCPHFIIVICDCCYHFILDLKLLKNLVIFLPKIDSCMLLLVLSYSESVALHVEIFNKIMDTDVLEADSVARSPSVHSN